MTTGQISFSGGIDSGRVPTIASEGYPDGLPGDSLAWATNAVMRGGGITSRYGWKKIVEGAPWSGLYQCGYMYEPDFAFPYLVLSIGGKIWQVRVDLNNEVNLLSGGATDNPPLKTHGFMCQGEQFLVIQAGDFVTLPLFWDGTTLRRSNGLTGINTPGNPNISELPPAGPMDYYMGRLWYAIGRVYTAGDIVRGPSGQLVPYNYRDAILRVTENPLAFGGDGFSVVDNAGNIRALHHTANLDTTLGQGPLYVFTRKQIYASQPPVNRNDWKAANENIPIIQTVAQTRFGTYSDRSVVSVNGDLFYQSPDGIRSLFIAIRYFQQWGNTSISKNENRILNFNDRGLMAECSGIEFDNRLLQTVLPVQTDAGTAYQAVVPLDFDLISSFGKKSPPAWEGAWEGLDFLQLLEGDFGGLQRAFAVVRSRETGKIEIWELSLSDRFENGDNRITWIIETPAYTWDKMFELKRLQSLELWIDRLFGTVEFKVYYRPDQNPCWYLWHAWKECAARDGCETIPTGTCPDYPVQDYCEQFRPSIVLPEPTPFCDENISRPTNFGYQFQVKIVIHGWCRIRGLLIHAIPAEQPPFDHLVCDSTIPQGTVQ